MASPSASSSSYENVDSESQTAQLRDAKAENATLRASIQDLGKNLESILSKCEQLSSAGGSSSTSFDSIMSSSSSTLNRKRPLLPNDHFKLLTTPSGCSASGSEKRTRLSTPVDHQPPRLTPSRQMSVDRKTSAKGLPKSGGGDLARLVHWIRVLQENGKWVDTFFGVAPCAERQNISDQFEHKIFTHVENECRAEMQAQSSLLVPYFMRLVKETADEHLWLCHKWTLEHATLYLRLVDQRVKHEATIYKLLDTSLDSVAKVVETGSYDTVVYLEDIYQCWQKTCQMLGSNFIGRLDDLLDFLTAQPPSRFGCILQRELVSLIGGDLEKTQWQRLFDYFHSGLKNFESTDCRIVAAEGLAVLMGCVDRLERKDVEKQWKRVVKQFSKVLNGTLDKHLVTLLFGEFGKATQLLAKSHPDLAASPTHLATINSLVVNRLASVMSIFELKLTPPEEKNLCRREYRECAEVDATVELLGGVAEMMRTQIESIGHSAIDAYGVKLEGEQKEGLQKEGCPMSVFSLMTRLLTNERVPSRYQEAAMSMFSDMIAKGLDKQLYEPHLDVLLAAVKKALGEEKHYQLRQTAAYTFGILAEQEGTRDRCIDLIPALVDSIEKRNWRMETGDHSARETAIASIVKLLRHTEHEDSIPNRAQLLRRLLSWLPEGQDWNDIADIYGFLVDTVEAGHFDGDESASLMAVDVSLAGLASGLFTPVTLAGCLDNGDPKDQQRAIRLIDVRERLITMAKERLHNTALVEMILEGCGLGDANEGTKKANRPSTSRSNPNKRTHAKNKAKGRRKY